MSEIKVCGFEKTSEGADTHLYTITNSNGASVTVCDFGATIMNLEVPTKSGKLKDVVLGYKHISEYENECSYFGATVGRCCGRIAFGKFTFNGMEYQLPVNSGGNHLHGGDKCFSRKVWDGQVIDDKVVFSMVSPDGEEGYMGNMTVSVAFEFNDNNELSIEYNATSDEDTICNLTNHTYFNLNGSDSNKPISDNHLLKLYADKFTPIDELLIPTGEERNVENTSFDFREGKLVKRGFDFEDTQVKIVNGIDHMFVVNRNSDELVLSGEMESILTGIKMKCYTTQKGLHIYTANTLEAKAEITKDQIDYGAYYGICFETQGYPDAVNHNNFPSVVLKANEKYHHITKFAFEVC
ncbi:MAG: aldose epimerase family protein [Ruminococcus sp.]|nr:aldose epimerase family protein [Ruminococcus sp.]